MSLNRIDTNLARLAAALEERVQTSARTSGVALAEAEIVAPDDFLTDKTTGRYSWTPDKARAAWIESYKKLDHLLKQPGYDTVVLMVGVQASGKSHWLTTNAQPGKIYFDAVFAQAPDRRDVIQKAKRAGKRVAAVVMTTPLDVCIARNEERKKTHPGKDVPADVIRSKCERLIADLPKESEGFATITFVPYKAAKKS